MSDYKLYMNEIKKLPNNNVIYILCDPISDEVRYVGKAENLYIRIRKHYNNSRLKTATHKNNWIKSLIDKGFRATVFVVEVCFDSKSMNESEIKWIKYYKELGCDLTNGTNGGDGGRMSSESIEKMRKTKLGKPHSKEHREAISKSKIGSILSEETKNKIGLKHKNKIVSEETRKKQSETRKGRIPWNKGKSPSEESKEKMRQSRLNYLSKSK